MTKAPLPGGREDGRVIVPSLPNSQASDRNRPIVLDAIEQGTVTASLMLRKFGSYPRPNGLAIALRELGRIERSLFILGWLQSVDLRRRVHAG